MCQENMIIWKKKLITLKLHKQSHLIVWRVEKLPKVKTQGLRKQKKKDFTLEFQREGEGGISGEAGIFRPKE